MTIAILIGQIQIHQKYIISFNKIFLIYKIIIEKCSSIIKFGCGKRGNTDLCTMQRHSECTRIHVSFGRPPAVFLSSFLHCTQCLFLAFSSLLLTKCPCAFSGLFAKPSEAAFCERCSIIRTTGIPSDELLAKRTAKCDQRSSQVVQLQRSLCAK